jgi:hypothetical protein
LPALSVNSDPQAGLFFKGRSRVERTGHLPDRQHEEVKKIRDQKELVKPGGYI